MHKIASVIPAVFSILVAAGAAQADDTYNIQMVKANTGGGSLRLSFGPGGCQNATSAAGNGVYVIDFNAATIPVVCMNYDGWKQVNMYCGYKGGPAPVYKDIPAGEVVEISVFVGDSPSTTTAYYTIAPYCTLGEGQAVQGGALE